MSYNFRVLLGWVGTTFPIMSSHDLTIMVARMGKDNESVYATYFGANDIWAQQAWTKQWDTTAPEDGMTTMEQFIAPHIDMQPYYGGTYANRWKIEYSIKQWVGPSYRPNDHSDYVLQKDWCTINPDTGTIHLAKDSTPYLCAGRLYQVDITCNLLEGGLAPSFLGEYRFTVYPTLWQVDAAAGNCPFGVYIRLSEQRR